MQAQDASASAVASGSDELGAYFRASIDPGVYGETAILKTAYWFTDQCYLFLARNRHTGLVDVEFRLKQGDSLDKLKALCGEFWNSLLDQSVRQRVLEETSSVRDVLLKKAFFEAKAPHLRVLFRTKPTYQSQAKVTVMTRSKSGSLEHGIHPGNGPYSVFPQGVGSGTGSLQRIL